MMAARIYMKIYASVVLLALLILSIPSLATTEIRPTALDGGKSHTRGIKVAVVEFDTRGNFAIPYAGSIVAEWMISELGRLGTFSLVERVLLKKVIAEQELSESGFVGSDKARAKLGELYGVNAIVTGSIMKWQQSVTITARLIDATSGEILKTASASARHISQAPRLINRLARELTGTAGPESAEQPSSQPGKAEAAEHAKAAGETPSATLQPPSPAIDLQRELPAEALATAEAHSTPVVHENQYWIEGNTGMRFVWIEPGCFIMGQSRPDETSDSDRLPKYHPDENPAHRVCLDGFWIAETETTNSQFRALVPDHDSGTVRGISLNGDRQPVIMVSWQQARAFASILNSRYQGAGARFRLPTEAEWEYAARAGSISDFPWKGRKLCAMANALDIDAAAIAPKERSGALKCSDGHAVTAAVGSYPPNAWGLYDMIGNVREWVEDIYNKDAYLVHEEKNPVYLGVGETRVTRGGSWMDKREELRLSARRGLAPDRTDALTGFRLVLERR